jgi:uncharacterized DUF497 family protein
MRYTTESHMLNVARLIWDAWNVQHIARHGVVPDEVDQVCQGEPVVSATYGGRLRVFGPTESGQILTAILSPQDTEGVYYVVTARPASRKERRRYQELKRGEDG